MRINELPTDAHPFILWCKRHKTALVRSGVVAFVVLMAVQMLYPVNKLPLLAVVDGQALGGWSAPDAAKRLDTLANTSKIDVKLGDSKDTYDTSTPKEMGVQVSNQSRTSGLSYPLLIRLVPTSLFWYGLTQGDGEPEYKRDTKQAAAYLQSTLGGESCNLPPKDASLEFKDESLSIVGAKNGGTCDKKEAVTAIARVRPSAAHATSVVVPVDIKKPAIADGVARQLKDSLTKNTKGGVRIKITESSERTAPQKDVLSWLTFASNGKKLAFTIDQVKANTYFNGTITPLVAKPAGTTKIATSDFTVSSQENGAPGQALAVPETSAEITKVLTGEQETAKVVSVAIAPKVVYSRSYSKTSTGIAALLKFYDEDRGGTFGVSFRELGGQGLVADHNSTKSFTTASTYKLYVAYGTLRKIDDGSWKWSDANIASGRDLTRCFDDMIVKSDNACAESLLKKLGFTQLTKDIQDLGLKGSTFASGTSPSTTASDLSTFLAKLQDGSLPVKPDSRSRLLDAMRRNVYRQGIPAGASGPVADKVGFLNGLLHDAAVVYSPKGTYVLTIMTDGSSWAEIADLSKQIEALR